MTLANGLSFGIEHQLTRDMVDPLNAWLIVGPTVDVRPPTMSPKVRGQGDMWCGGEAFYNVIDAICYKFTTCNGEENWRESSAN